MPVAFIKRLRKDRVGDRLDRFIAFHQERVHVCDDGMCQRRRRRGIGDVDYDIISFMARLGIDHPDGFEPGRRTVRLRLYCKIH